MIEFLFWNLARSVYDVLLFSSQNDNRKLGQDATQYDAWQQLKLFQQQQQFQKYYHSEDDASKSETNSSIDQTSQNYPKIDRRAAAGLIVPPKAAIATRTNMPVPLLRVSHYDKAGNHCPWEISRVFLVCGALE